MKEIEEICRKLAIEVKYIDPLIHEYSLEQVKNNLIIISKKTKNKEFDKDGLLNKPYLYLKHLLSEKKVNKNINNLKEELSYTEYSKLIENHGKDFIDLKIDYTENLANKFEINNIKELLLYLIDNDIDSKKYGINPLIKNEIKSIQEAVNEFNKTANRAQQNITNSTKATAKIIEQGMTSLEKNVSACTIKLIDSYKETTDKNVETVKAVNNKYIHQSRNIFDGMNDAAKKTLMPEVEKTAIKMEENYKGYLKTTTDKIDKIFDISVKSGFCVIIGTLLLGMFAGIYMQPIIAQLTERTGMHYTLVYILLCSIIPLCAGAVITAFLNTKFVRDRW
jgi:hypothetical protein